MTISGPGAWPLRSPSTRRYSIWRSAPPWTCRIRRTTPRTSSSGTPKKQNYYLITIRHDKRVDLKEFQRRHGTTRLSFASPEDLMARLHLTPGSVTPLGLLNDPDRSVQFYLDRNFEGGRIGVHPNDNTATVWLSTRDLLDLLREHGSPVQWAEI